MIESVLPVKTSSRRDSLGEDCVKTRGCRKTQVTMEQVRQQIAKFKQQVEEANDRCEQLTADLKVRAPLPRAMAALDGAAPARRLRACGGPSRVI